MQYRYRINWLRTTTMVLGLAFCMACYVTLAFVIINQGKYAP